MSPSRANASLPPIAGEPELVRRARSGDQDAFARLYDAYLERIYRYVYFRVAEDATAEDITAQVFLKAWEKLDSFQSDGAPFIAWLYRIAHNAVIDHYRTRKESIALEEARPVEISQADEVDEQIDLQFESQQLRTALRQLTEDQQQILILKFMNGLTTVEIAEQLGKQPGAIRALQMRALQALAKLLDL